MPRPVAIFCSDLHFSHRPPVARSAEPDWYAAMARAWGQVRDAAQEHRVPIVVAGDIFDRWQSPPELINFVIRLFDGLDIYAVPGQHDLPNHSYADLDRSAYATLMAAGVLHNLDPGQTGGIPLNHDAGLWAWAFPWGRDIEPVDEEEDAGVKLAVVHKYVWLGSCKYQGASDETHTSAYKAQLRGYDVAAFGDNHKGFVAGLARFASSRTTLVNCGGLMGRTIDEREYSPRFCLLYDDKSVSEQYLDTSEDRWLDAKDVAAAVDSAVDLRGLVAGLETLGGDALNFAEVLRRYLETAAVDPEVQQLVRVALEEGRGSGA